ncbi:type II toxin-antitoxin system PemK/MazF family toxin [Leptolyngbya iicbica]|uniref:Type II toxin-antitoxin system PemK/MazF family toxin n=2 Tax=Cyanophyceae TaxID=3028117 RepID=A0A4Q7DZL3_9CYAN|nr:type II toxin-antitoxin system PemK/MazF family toxin [Leptolyngbya sp. LK]RZM74360.1 type II toxin-antitoxin system PemK/MazF family toxin [Leptolyngbya sp. LK]
MVVKGSVVLVNFPFTDLSQTKLRPAVILWVAPVGIDVVVCAITSQQLDHLEAGEFKLEINDLEFRQTGLRVSSKVRVTRVVTLERRLVVRKLGDLGKQYLQELNRQIIESYQLA